MQRAPWIIAAIAVSFAIYTAFASRPAPPIPTPAENAERVQRGPQITMSKDISPSETVRVLTIPHPLGPYFDTPCVIYINQEFKTSSMQCPAADNHALLDSSARQP